ncbi:MAG: hypothetical protein AB7I42_24935 [Bradyrhizobium sp.]|uniref:hypothetical protein n=1 Tax=Bradyrhizobium sp. TaxID=376 RepID=UPI003D09A2F3
MITVATCFWDANPRSYSWSRCYSELWVERLFRGFQRNLTVPFRFVCFSEREREYSEPAIEQERLTDPVPNCGSLVEPYRLNEPMILVGLDTVIVGNLDHMAEYALAGNTLALTKDPYGPEACTGVAVVPAGQRGVWETYDGNPNDMVHLRKQEHVFIDDLWPGHARSFKAHVANLGWLNSRIVYMHGRPKMNDLPADELIVRHWR